MCLLACVFCVLLFVFWLSVFLFVCMVVWLWLFVNVFCFVCLVVCRVRVDCFVLF